MIFTLDTDFTETAETHGHANCSSHAKVRHQQRSWQQHSVSELIGSEQAGRRRQWQGGKARRYTYSTTVK